MTAVGGVPGEVVARLARLPYPLAVEPRIEAVVAVRGVARCVHAGRAWTCSSRAPATLGAGRAQRRSATGANRAGADCWSPSALGREGRRGDRRAAERRIPAAFTVGGVLPEAAPDDVIVLDIATADRALGREGRVDRILVRLPAGHGRGTPAWTRGRPAPRGAARRRRPAPPRRRHGPRTGACCGAFRWNLRVLCYVALIVGAFLIYNTISVSVVRRRAEIGVVRALGASRRSGDGGLSRGSGGAGPGGRAAGLPLGRAMASGAVGLIGGDRERRSTSAAGRARSC